MSRSPFITESEVESVAAAQEELQRNLRIVAPKAIDPDTADVEGLRQLVKQLLAKQSAPVEPLGEDAFSGLPVFFDKPECPRCKPFLESWRDPETGLSHRLCHDCNQPIAHSIEFQNSGVESATVDHLHLHTVLQSKGVQIRVPVRRELCLPCFRLDWAKVNPNKPCDL